MRGEVHIRTFVLAVVGITPACAGRSSRGAPTACIARDHPRVCGEKDFVIYETPPVLGSPPRVRGEVTPSRVRNRCIRITPACAGRRSTWGPHRCSAGDHPRVCGEKLLFGCGKIDNDGSPPRVRGEVCLAVCRVVRDGITPACAGRRSSRGRCASTTEDHPRVCGEKRVSQPFRRSISGSPPACAGRRRACVKTFFKGGDHPRVCGEKERRGKTRERTSGSPPRVRGEA